MPSIDHANGSSGYRETARLQHESSRAAPEDSLDRGWREIDSSWSVPSDNWLDGN